MFWALLCPLSGEGLYKTASGVSLDVLAAVVWSRDTSWAHVPTPHNRSQHIQAYTRCGFIQSVLLTMGIMMPETCWVNLLWINIYTCVICWFFLLQPCDCILVLKNVQKSSMVLISALLPENEAAQVALIGLCFNRTELHTT